MSLSCVLSDVMPVPFEGAKMMLNKGLSNHFQVSHTLNLCSTSPSGYRFGATYVGTKQFTPNEAYPVLLGDIDPSGNLNANLIHQFSPQLRLKFASQVNYKLLSILELGLQLYFRFPPRSNKAKSQQRNLQPIIVERISPRPLQW